MTAGWRVLKRTFRSFYDDQMTHHAAALTYYALMSLFPTLLLGIALLGLLGQYPGTYLRIIEFLREVAPAATVDALDGSVREAVRNKGTAATALAVAVVVALYGTTGVLEAARRALNVVFEVRRGRTFLRRKSIDVASTVVLGALLMAAATSVFVGADLARDLFELIGLEAEGPPLWSVARWPAALIMAVLAFSWVYYVTPDVHHRGFRWVTPGAVVGVLLWLAASWAFSAYLTNFSDVSALYGAFAAAIVLVVWLWLTSVALLFGAELDAEIERAKELSEGVPLERTLALREKHG